MNQFASAVRTITNTTTTANGMKAFHSTNSACVDLFYGLGGMRGQDITSMFINAFKEDPELACRIALWGRDARQGAGERKLYRDILGLLSTVENADFLQSFIKGLIYKTPVVGRWDDLFSFKGKALDMAITYIANVLLTQAEGYALLAKWIPRKGKTFDAIRAELSMTPKQFRKLLVKYSNTVEQKMCANQWSNINYEHVPSRATQIYTKAFARHDVTRFKEYKEALVKGEAKVNASVVYPYQIIDTIKNDPVIAQAQWEAQPDYMGDNSVLPVVDMSESMYSSPYTRSSGTTPVDIAMSLGIYTATKNKGVFKDLVMSFSSTPSFINLATEVTLIDKFKKLARSTKAYSTNMVATIELILNTAIKNNVPKEDMPKTIIFFSDMQFNDSYIEGKSETAMEAIRNRYTQAGYNAPNIVFWNLNYRDNAPVTMSESGVALVSGFSPSILKSVLKADYMTPEKIMFATVSSERYNFLNS